MPKIRILPEQLANRIAAGEVVERPASVVKELIENSLDAGADRIEVEIEGGGTRLIRIIDNGEGMDEDDILLCFERHGTSKIHDAHDLVAITTLGFRGEAIPSIASVAKMTVISRTHNNNLGTRVEFEYGRLQKVHEIGCGYGTVIEIRNLFGRTPARKKFLRTTRTELGHIDEVVKNYALACPQTAFSLTVNERQTLNFDSSHSLTTRLKDIIRYNGSFITVGKNLPKTTKRQLFGYLVPPEETSGGPSRLRLFINGRAIKDRLMSHAVFEGLRGFLLKGHSPAGYIHLQLPAEEIDVNVHPAKHEVRFRNTGDIHQFIKQHIEEAMHAHQQTVRVDLFGEKDTQKNIPELEKSFYSSATDEQRSLPVTSAALQTYLHRHSEEQKDMIEKASSSSIDSFPPPQMEPDISEPAVIPQPVTTHQKGSARDHGLLIIGQFKNLYIFCQTGDNLIVIDQHAAHERLLYEKFRKQYGEGNLTSQTLMFPETLELSAFHIQLVENNFREIEKMGFAISEFGGNSYIISAIPALAGQCNVQELFLDVLNGFGKDTEQGTGASKILDILATKACKAAVKSGTQLSQPEIEALLAQMAKADLFSHCPHGRPVLKTFSTDEIKKWFHRT